VSIGLASEILLQDATNLIARVRLEGVTSVEVFSGNLNGHEIACSALSGPKSGNAAVVFAAQDAHRGSHHRKLA
jgi:hypothetical protein